MIWRILEKDLRRLWLPLLATLALLAALSVVDAWRYDFEVGLAETVLNVLLPLAWGLLIALAVQLEPTTSDRAFWLSRPYRRSALFASKAVFALLAVHLPLLIAHAAVLMSHGFSPFESELLWKQATVLFAVTVPSLAIASVTSTISGFGWCALTAGLMVVLLDASLTGHRFPWNRADWMPGALALAVLAVGGVAILSVQYLRRTRWMARCIGSFVAVSAVLTYSYVPRDLTAAMQCSLEPDLSQPVSVSYQPEAPAELPVPGFIRPGQVPVAVPIRIQGVAPPDFVLTEQLFLRASSASGGPSWQVERDLSADRRAFLRIDPEGGQSFQWFVPDRSFVQVASSSPVQVEGRLSLRRFVPQEERVFPSTFAPTDVPGVGRCSSEMLIASYREALKVTCESPSELPPRVRVTLINGQTGREWRQHLGDSGNQRLMPSIDWLSPLERRQTFLHVADHQDNRPGGQWVVPRDLVRGSQIRIQPTVRTGCVNVEYAFTVPDLRKWVVPVRGR